MHKKLATTTKGNAREIYVHHTLPVIPCRQSCSIQFYTFEILNYQQQNPSVEARKDEQNYTRTRWKGKKTIHHKNVNLSSLTRTHNKHNRIGVKPPRADENSRKEEENLPRWIVAEVESQSEERGEREGNVVWLNSHWMINDLQIGLWFLLENLHETCEM